MAYSITEGKGHTLGRTASEVSKQLRDRFHFHRYVLLIKIHSFIFLSYLKRQLPR